MTNPLGDLLTIDEVAAQVGCCRDTVVRAIKRRELPASKIAGWKIRPADVLEWWDAKQVPAPTPTPRRPGRPKPPRPARTMNPDTDWEAEFERKWGKF